jgi:4-hydroxy-tetrahydrodipicolinate synthase
VDHGSYERYIQQLPLSPIQGLVLNGTTGESPTGTNDTVGTIKRTEQAGLLGADAALIVVPYYSRPSQAGIIEHYRQIAQVGVPIMVYDIPGRTGVSLTVDTLRTLFEIEGVIGLKDSTGSTQMISELVRYDSKPILCGEDIFKSGDHEAAKDIFARLLSLIRLLFKESNPAPLKWMLAQKGLIARIGFASACSRPRGASLTLEPINSLNRMFINKKHLYRKVVIEK